MKTRTVYMVDGQCPHGSGGPLVLTAEKALDIARGMLAGECYRGMFCNCVMTTVSIEVKDVPDCGQFRGDD
jgi:hypothetical protein